MSKKGFFRYFLVALSLESVDVVRYRPCPPRDRPGSAVASLGQFQGNSRCARTRPSCRGVSGSAGPSGVISRDRSKWSVTGANGVEILLISSTTKKKESKIADLRGAN